MFFRESASELFYALIAVDKRNNKIMMNDTADFCITKSLYLNEWIIRHCFTGMV